MRWSEEKKKSVFRMPELSVGSRIILYFVAGICIALSMAQVIFKFLPAALEIVIYVLAACTLFAGSYYAAIHIRRDIRDVIRPAVMKNPYTRRVVTEYRLRTILFTVPGTFSNIVFAVFHAVVGIVSSSAWFGTMAAYYILLSVMRVGAVNKERRIRRIREDAVREKEEQSVYYRNSVLFVLMAIVLGGAVILLECSAGGKEYPGLTIYAAAAYSFYKVIMSSINMVKVGKQNSMLLAIIRRIGYIDACVSILTLQTAMFQSFAQGEEKFVKIMNGITGAVVCLMVLAMGLYGLHVVKKRKKQEERADD